MKLEKLSPVGPKEFPVSSFHPSAFSFDFLSADKNECTV